MKKSRLGLMVLVLSVLLAPSAVTAAHADCGSKQCATAQKDCDKSGCEKGESSGCPINGKIMKKAKFFLANAKEIGLSDAQVEQIKAIKVAAKKTAIRQAAEMQVFEIDMNAKLSEAKLDVEGVNAMLDQASAGWGTGAKASVAEYAKLKAVLNDAQMAKAKEIWARDEKKS